MAQPSFRVNDKIDEWVEERTKYSNNKSQWYRYAAQTMRSADLAMDEIYERYQYDERREFVVEAIEKHLEDKKRELNHMD